MFSTNYFLKRKRNYSSFVWLCPVFPILGNALILTLLEFILFSSLNSFEFGNPLYLFKLLGVLLLLNDVLLIFFWFVSRDDCAFFDKKNYESTLKSLLYGIPILFFPIFGDINLNGSFLQGFCLVLSKFHVILAFMIKFDFSAIFGIL